MSRTLRFSLGLISLSGLAVAQVGPGVPPAPLQVNALRNGGFQESVLATTPGNPEVLGSYWLAAEDKVVELTGGERVLVLDREGEHAMQRFAAYGYRDQGPAKEEGTTHLLRIQGDLIVTDPNSEIRVVLEESPRGWDNAAGSYNLYPPPNNPPMGQWSYLSRDVATGMLAAMNPQPNADVPHLGFWRSPFAAGTVIQFESQRAVPAATAIRLWKAPVNGKVLLQTRVLWDRKNLPAALNPALVSVSAKITVYQDSTLQVPVQTILPLTAIPAGDGLELSRYFSVQQNQVVAFETQELGTTTIGVPLLLDPTLTYPARKVVYRFGHNLTHPPSNPEPDTLYVAPIDTPTGYVWQHFDLPVGADYAAWVQTQYGETAHGPIPQLTLRLEAHALPAGVYQAVGFDHLNVRSELRNVGKAGIVEEIRSEMSRMIDIHLKYGAGAIGSTPPELHSRWKFDITSGASIGALPNPGFSPLSGLIEQYSRDFYHVAGTPWLLAEVDSLIEHKHPTLGFFSPYDFGAQAYTTPATGDKFACAAQAANMIRMYDLTKDLRALDAADRIASAILNYGLSTSEVDAVTGLERRLYQSLLGYRKVGTVETMQLPETPLDFEKDYTSWGVPAQVFAMLHARTAPYGARYPNSAAYLTAARAVARWLDHYWDTKVVIVPPFWGDIENQVDDVIGYQLNACVAADEAAPSAEFKAVITKAVTQFQPEWIQTFPRSTRMAGDQTRAWPGWLHYFRLDPPQRVAFGQAYVDAARNYLASIQLGNGVWSQSNVSHFQHPDLSGSGGTPTTAADANKLIGLIQAITEPALVDEGIMNLQLKEELRGYIATILRMNEVHYGHFLESIPGLVTAPEGQLGYMLPANYPAPVDTSDTTVLGTGQEFRSLGVGSHLFEAFRSQIAQQAPSVSIAPGDLQVTTTQGISSQVLTVSDPNGTSAPPFIVLAVTEYSGETPVNTTLYLPQTDPKFTMTVTQPDTWTFTWAQPPTLTSGRSYRFMLTAIDAVAPAYRWDVSCARYEIP